MNRKKATVAKLNVIFDETRDWREWDTINESATQKIAITRCGVHHFNKFMNLC